MSSEDEKLSLAYACVARLTDEKSAIEAENARLRNVMMELATRHFAGNLIGASKEKELDQYLSEGIRQLQEERDAALAQLAAIQQAKGEEVKADTGYKPDARIMQTLASLATRKPLMELDALLEGRDRVSARQVVLMLSDAGSTLVNYAFTLRQDFDSLRAQHQRITAAMAAEVELLRDECRRLSDKYERDVWGLNNEGDPIGGEPAGGFANDLYRVTTERDALRAELAAVKGQDKP